LLEAIAIDPSFTAAYVNLADLYRNLDRDAESEQLLRRGLERAADTASIEFSLGLTLVRLGKRDEALSHLRRAHQMRPEMVRFGYVYAVAQFDTGKREPALRTLEHMHKRFPANREVLQLLVSYSQELGRTAAAERYAKTLERLSRR
jgi:Tfp pilus assembly protein PilF